MNKVVSFLFYGLCCFGLNTLHCEEKGQMIIQFDLDKDTTNSEKLLWAKAFIFQGLHMLASEKNPEYKEVKEEILRTTAKAILEIKDKK